MGGEAVVGEGLAGVELVVALGFLLHLGRSVFPEGGQLAKAIGQLAEGIARRVVEGEGKLPFAPLFLVAFLQHRSRRFVVAGDGLVGFIGNRVRPTHVDQRLPLPDELLPFLLCLGAATGLDSQFLDALVQPLPLFFHLPLRRLHLSGQRNPDQAVAALDAVVEEAERLARPVPLQPEGEFAQVNGQRVEVHSVDAVRNHIPHGEAELLRRRLVLTAPHPRQLPPDAPRGSEEEVTASTCRVANLEGEKSLF